MNTIEKLQFELSSWYDESSLSKFMVWWKYHLKSFVPEKYQKSIFIESNSVYLVANQSDEVQVWCKTDNDEDIQRVESSDESWWHQVQHLVNEADGKPLSIEYLLPKSKVLVRKIALPAAAKDNLEEVIGFELDKYIPFDAEQVQLSHKIDAENSSEERLLVDLVAVPNDLLASVISQSEEKAIQLSSIDVNNADDESPQSIGVNLLPRDKRKTKDYTNLKVNTILGLLLLGLIYFVMSTSVSAKQNKIDQLTEVNTELQKQARTSKLLKKELKEAIVSSQFLSKKMQTYQSPVRLISEVTQIFPDHTYVTRLRITEAKIEVTGESENANGLIPKMDKSELWFTPKIPQAIRPNARTGKEMFTIEAGLVEEEGDSESSS